MAKVNKFGIVLLTPVMIGVIWMVSQTSDHVEWGGGYWEQWLVGQWQITAGMAHEIVFYLRKTGHFLFYGTLALLFQIYFRMWGLLRPAVPLGLAAAAGVAAFDEYRQSLVSFRSGQLEDVILDICGAITFTALVWWRRRSGRIY